MRFYLIRHGQTKWNTEGKIQGKTDVPLDRVGLCQAKLLAGGMRQYEVAGIYASPLKRALETAQAVAEEKNLPVCRLDELRERDFGLWEGLGWEKIRMLYRADFLAWEKNPIEGMPTGGEPKSSCEERCRRAVETILSERKDGGDAAVVAHGGILVFLLHFLLRNQTDKKEIIVRNASISVVEYDRETALGTLISLNDTSHLGTVSSPLRWELERQKKQKRDRRDMNQGPISQINK